NSSIRGGKYDTRMIKAIQTLGEIPVFNFFSYLLTARSRSGQKTLRSPGTRRGEPISMEKSREPIPSSCQFHLHRRPARPPSRIRCAPGVRDGSTDAARPKVMRSRRCGRVDVCMNLAG
ncbi:unnamed protein product, partial [Nesidiocoris tenuis]